MAVGLAMALLTCIITQATGVIPGTTSLSKTIVFREPANPSPSTRPQHASITKVVTHQKPPDPPSPVDSEMAEQRFFGHPFNDFPFGLHPSQLQQPASRPPIFPGPSISSGGGPFQSGTAPHVRPVAPSRLLGSGNFAVLRGGTYYGSDEDGDDIGHHPFLSFGNAHGGGHHLGSHPPRFPPPRDFLSNFRDFADLHAHAPQAFSHRTNVFAPSSAALDDDYAASDTAPNNQKPPKKYLSHQEKSKKWRPPKEEVAM